MRKIGKKILFSAVLSAYLSSSFAYYSVSAQEIKKSESKAETENMISDFGIILQTPELPTGCEITALTMVLNYYGNDVDKVTMASEYLPVVPAETHEGSDGRLYGPDMNSYFVGNPFEHGYICGTTAIVNAADSYLESVDSSLKAVDMTGASCEDLYQCIRHKQPVVVWVTIGMKDRRETSGWYTEDGNYVEWSSNDHGAVLIGYTDDTVTIADPIDGIVEYTRTQFEKVFQSRGNQCVILGELPAK